MPKKSKKIKFVEGVHDDAYELTKEDFKKSVRATDHPVIGAMLKKGRGPQKAKKKVPTSIRLSSDVLDHFKKSGDGCQTRIDDVLRANAFPKRGDSTKHAGNKKTSKKKNVGKKRA